MQRDADWPVLDVSPDLRLCVTRDMPALDPALDAEVERLWTRARAARPLFNGQVFCADRITPERIDGHWTEYRRAVAQMVDPALKDALRIRSLAVCGALCGPDGVLAGLRDTNAVYQAGEWQLPPAGSVDSGAAEPGGASWRRALLAELEEELGIGADRVTGLRPLCLVHHPSGVLDLGIRIDTDLGGAEILAAHRDSGNAEYERLLIAPAAELPGRIAALGGRLVPSGHAFLARLSPAPSPSGRGPG
ncbi:MAG TPA: hypothetical protein VE650_16590 [Acetobacteraceae bacterium]|nr:hypothetical protein [Acetobacteraceae bacterium]